MGNSNIFSLEQVYRRQLTKNWTDIFDPFIYVTGINPAQPEQVANPAYGHFAGSYYPYRSDIDRIDYSNDTSTASVKGKLPVEASYGGGTGNNDYGYTIGGFAPSGASSYVFRQDYANDTATSSTRGPLSVRGYYCRAIGNANYGYCGGRDDNQNLYDNFSIIDRIDYANDTATATATAPAGMVPSAMSYGTVGNQSYGYFVGGYSPAFYDIVSSVRRLDYASDTGTSLKGPLTFKTQSIGGASNANYGYVSSGQYGSPSPLSVVHRIDFANDTATAATKGPFSFNLTFRSGTGSGDYGYFSGGDPADSRVDRIDYANDTTTASPKGPLSSPRKVPYAYSPQENGLPSANIPSIPRSANPATQYEPPLPPALPSGPAYGYSGGGGAGISGTRELGGTVVQRINFANDTASTNRRGELAYDHLHGAAFGNTTHGYVMGDLMTTTPRSWVSRITYASDSSTASSRGNMTVARGGGSATGNASYAWVSGAWDWIYGTAGPNASVVNRIDFANDSATMLARGNLDRAVGKVSASGNANYGWWYGGSGSNPFGDSSVSRVDYGNDTVTASPKGTMSGNVNENTAVGNVNYGYTTRGNNSYTDFLRYDYANDTGASTPKGSLSFMRRDFAGATGSQSYGYFMGGTGQPSSTYHTTIDRIDYSNDTAVASPKGNLQSQIPGSTGQRRAGGFSGQSNAFGTQPVPSTSKLVDKGSDGYQITSLGPAMGYFAGGVSPSYGTVTQIQRIDYASDTATASVKGNLPINVDMGGGTGNLTHGYVMGGRSSSDISYVYRSDYANDTATAATKGPLSAGGSYLQSIGNNNYGYTGGRTNNFSLIDRVDYANDTATASVPNPTGCYPGASSRYAAVGNQSYGYFVSGSNDGGSTMVTTVRRLDYSNDSAATSPKGPINNSHYSMAGTGNANYGYVTSGGTGGSITSRIDRIDYANDTATASPKGPTSSGAYRCATSSDNFGYFSGGGFPVNSRTDRIDYANDSATASPKGPLNFAVRSHQSFSAQQSGLFSLSYIPRARWIDSTLETGPTSPIPAGPAMGYLAGGMSPAYGTYTQVQRIDFASDTATAVQKGNLSSEHQKGGGTGSNSYGYCLGGETPHIASTVQRSDYANDTAVAVTRGPLSAAGMYVASVGNIDYAYTGGRSGSPSFSVPNNYSIMDRVDYSNDTATATVPNATGFYPAGNSYAAVGNQSYGYFAGGYDNPYGDFRSTVRRLDYSNDSATTSPKGPLINKGSKMAGTGNASYGWINNNANGGNSSTICRIEYANDTATASPKGNLNSDERLRAATGSADYGYFTGGLSPVNTFVDRINYANDNIGASPKGNLVYAVRSHMAFSARELGLPQTPIPVPSIVAPFQPPFPFPVENFDVPTTGYGYVAGGDYSSRIERIDYANDTATASLRSNLPTRNEDGGGAGNQSYGYTMGGYDGNSWGGASRVYRVDYANDTATASERGPLTSGRKYVDSIGNNNYGYTDGGYPSYTQSRIDRVDYANDTNTATSLGNIFSPGNRGTDTAGNLNYGYWGGGGGYLPRQSTVTRLDYASDTAPTSPRGPLSHPSSSNVAVGNANYGYWQISYFPSTRTQLDRVDYANDTATALPKGNLVAAGGYRQTATGNPNYGYFAGGYNYPSYLSTIQRINYLNDTATASPKGPLTNHTYDAQSFSAHENGLSG